MRYLFTLLFLLGSFPAYAEMQNGIAAIVNEDIITTNDVQGRVAMAIQGANMKPDAKILKELYKQALDSLIDEQIRLQEANRLGITPDEKELAETFAKISEQNGLSPEQFKMRLQATEGLYESLQQQLKTLAAWGNVVRRKIRTQIVVSEEDINAYLEEKKKNPAKFESQVAEIFLRQTDANIKMATQLINELRSGKQRFSVIARQFSQGLEASKGGLLGWIPDGTLEAPLDETIRKTPVGQLSSPVESPRGIHIFLVRERKEILPLAESSQRLVLKRLGIPLAPNAPSAIRTKAEQFLVRLKSRGLNCTTIDKEIALANNPLSTTMPETRLGDLPPQIMRVVKTLALDTLSEPVSASDGLALFMVCKRDEGMDDKIREDVATIIGTERLNRLQYRYYRDLRAASYVDIR
jgi:peptidyl-prolyl cis-trans isomerase SurA